MRKLFILSIILFCFTSSKAQTLSEQIQTFKQEQESLEQKLIITTNELDSLKLLKIIEDLNIVGLPKSDFKDQIITHSAMILGYAEEFEQARWVTHIITPDIVQTSFGRSNDFREDDKVSTGSSKQEDYFLVDTLENGKLEYDGFGYDRGHLAPSADFRWSEKALSESFLYSNMSPQKAEFNRDIWAHLEDALRGYVIKNNTPLYVVTLPILSQDLPKIERGVNKVAIPKQYVKIAIDLKNNRGIAFLLPNASSTSLLTSFTTSIDEIEKLTQIDFFPSLEDELENKLELMTDGKEWIPSDEQQDVEPIAVMSLPKGYFNTNQAKYKVGNNKNVTICGTVVSTKLSGKGNIFINLDRAFPNQVFTVSIFANNVKNFPYKPEEYLKGKTICVTGKVSEFNGTPSMSIENGKSIFLYEKEEE
ncbi:DNA/RNA non-specific endonuclease [Bernardetia sp. Wsw4-3y2]|uniref:DNA/RNA non-specific endonuclease n=1 Tax=Bernardetia sp. Wsw4-3y2 TaxID=3127471 RepID=UPI0030CAD460